MHTVHGADLSCQVCHSVTYTSCDGCHVAVSEKTGKSILRNRGHLLHLPDRHESAAQLHPPLQVCALCVMSRLTRTAFSFYGENLLSNFNSTSTWVYATPHNIQLKDTAERILQCLSRQC